MLEGITPASAQPALHRGAGQVSSERAVSIADAGAGVVEAHHSR
jgi:hypothetical protein